MIRCAALRQRAFLALLAIAFGGLLAPMSRADADDGSAAHAFGEPEPATFFLEELRVEGIERGSKEVVLAESRLRVDTSYTEGELRDAVVRIHRLPFVLTTEFTLQKGSERNAYVLVIRVFETHRLFYAVEARHTQVDEPLVLDGNFADEATTALRATAGYRLRLGAYGEAVAAADTEQGLQAGYTHYDLFGRGGAVSLAVSKDYDDSTVVMPLGLDPRFSSWRFDRGQLATASVALPLSGNHGLVLRGEWLHGSGSSEREVRGGSELADRLNRRAETDLIQGGAAWIWDDSDDPVTPRSGRTMELGIEFLQLDAEGVASTLVQGAGPPQTVDSDLAPLDSELARLVGRATVHVPFGTSNTASWSGGLALGRARISGLPLGPGELSPQSYSTAEASLGLVLRRVLWQPAKRFETLWLEGLVDVTNQSVDLDLPVIGDSVTQGRVGLRLTFRDSWGVLRAGLFYVAVDGTGP